MRVLVTGGAGFIGSHLCEALIERGNDVLALDDLSTGHLDNLSRLRTHPRFHFVEGDVRSGKTVKRFVDESECVFHLAAAVGVKYVVDDPLRSLITNVKGTEVVLQMSARHRRRVVLFSSSEVYGKSDELPFAEDQDLQLGPTHKPRWSYACSKALDECLAFAYQQKRQLPVTIVRCFNTCGPRQTGAYGMVIPNMVFRALRGEPILVCGDGRQSRCFSAVHDVVRGVLLLVDQPAAIGQVFNIGTDEEVTIADLAHRIRRKCESISPIEFVPYEAIYGHSFEDMRRRVPDLTKIRRLVGYRPTIALDDLLELIIRDMCQRLGMSVPAGAAA
jgi:UDP-glucose 4-epimerase